MSISRKISKKYIRETVDEKPTSAKGFNIVVHSFDEETRYHYANGVCVGYTHHPKLYPMKRPTTSSKDKRPKPKKVIKPSRKVDKLQQRAINWCSSGRPYKELVREKPKEGPHSDTISGRFQAAVDNILIHYPQESPPRFELNSNWLRRISPSTLWHVSDPRSAHPKRLSKFVGDFLQLLTSKSALVYAWKGRELDPAYEYQRLVFPPCRPEDSANYINIRRGKLLQMFKDFPHLRTQFLRARWLVYIVWDERAPDHPFVFAEEG
jgi:hypothetical protein